MVVVMVMANRDYQSWINLERNSITVNGSFSFDQINRRKGDGELFRDRLHPANRFCKNTEKFQSKIIDVHSSNEGAPPGFLSLI